MWQYPEIDPVALALGPLRVHWYAISYLIGIGITWWLLRQRRTGLGLGWSDEKLSDMLFYGVLGMILGGRVGYVLFYGTDSFLADPTVIFRIWQGGMSFHGGLLGVLLGMWLFARKQKRSFFTVTDLVAPCIPLALGCGRIGNFINAELPGRETDVAWAVIYPGDEVARHPSSLYQAFLEGPVLFAALWLYGRVPRPEMAVSGAFLLGYGALRFFSEFFRTPDAHLGFVAFDWMTQGQLLSLPMVILGIGFIGFAYKRSRT